jgi:hypothetical protein
MEDITSLVHARKCGYLYVQCVHFTFVYPTMFETKWLIQESDKMIRWFMKNVSDLPGKEYTLCRKFIEYIMTRFFNVSSEKIKEKSARKLAYKKLRFFSDASDKLLILYMLSPIEYDILTSQILPTLDGPLIKFSTEPKPGQVVVRIYRYKTRTWPKLMAVVLAATAITGISLYKGSHRPSKVFKGNLGIGFNPDEPKLTQIEYLPGCFYSFVTHPSLMWKQQQYETVVVTMISAIDQHVPHLSTSSLNLFEPMMKLLKNEVIHNAVILLVDELLIRSADDIVYVWKNGGWQFNNIKPSWLIALQRAKSQFPVFTAEHLSLPQEEELTNLKKNAAVFKDNFEKSKIDIVAANGVRLFIQSNPRYAKILQSYIYQYFIVLLMNVLTEAHAEYEKYKKIMAYVFAIVSKWSKPENKTFETLMYPAIKLYRIFDNRIELLKEVVFVENKGSADLVWFRLWNDAASAFSSMPRSKTKVSYCHLLHFFAGWFMCMEPRESSFDAWTNNMSKTMEEIIEFLKNPIPDEQQNAMYLAKLIVSTSVNFGYIGQIFLDRLIHILLPLEATEHVKRLLHLYKSIDVLDSSSFIQQVNNSVNFFEQHLIGEILVDEAEKDTSFQEESPSTPRESPSMPGESPSTPGESPSTPGESPSTPGESSNLLHEAKKPAQLLLMHPTEPSFLIETYHRTGTNCALRAEVKDGLLTVVAVSRVPSEEQFVSFKNNPSLFAIHKINNTYAIRSVAYPTKYLALQKDARDEPIMLRELPIKENELVTAYTHESEPILISKFKENLIFQLFAGDTNVGFYPARFYGYCGSSLRGNVDVSYTSLNSAYYLFTTIPPK